MKPRNSLCLLLCLLIALPGWAQNSTAFHQVQARKNADDPNWKTYRAQTVDQLPGFNIRKKEPQRNAYGSWKTKRSEATGFFRTEKKGDRWWLIDPEGYPFIHKGVAVFRAGGSEKQQAAMQQKYGSPEKWAQQETEMLRTHGFNGLGAWSDVERVRALAQPVPYTVIVSPMGSYRAAHRKKHGGEYLVAGWQGYRFDLAMVFDPEFQQHVEDAIRPIAQYAQDKYLLGYYTDNELPWKNDALDRHLTFLAKDEAGYLAAQQWLDARKGKPATLADVSDADRLAFTAFYFEAYIKAVSAAVRKYDPNHLYLGCRFNQEKEELQNPAVFEVAGRYADVISINHYRQWEPSQQNMQNWATWSGKPFLITEWYTKGEDSGLPNRTGAGWNVPTQQDRGLFYQNFVLELLKSKSCVGWHWFTYQDNDPENLQTDYSNRDSNKGIVSSAYQPYEPLLALMAQLNHNVYSLIQYLDKRPPVGRIGKSPP